jgi:hypothetical protein
MGFVFRRSFGLGRGSRLNLSGRGVSVSKRVGRVSLNSRGGFSIRLLKGLSYRGRLK